MRKWKILKQNLLRLKTHPLWGILKKVAKVHRTPTKVLSEQIFTKLIPSGA